MIETYGYARAGLLGNPSDGYFGKTISFAMSNFRARVLLYPSGRLEIKPEAKLRAVLEISRYLSTALDLKDVLPKILECLFAVFPQADRGFILLQDPNTGQFVEYLLPKETNIRRVYIDNSTSPVRLTLLFCSDTSPLADSHA